MAAGALGRELSQISMETIRPNMDVRPTLAIKAGTPFYIFLARDLVLEGAYVDQRTPAGWPTAGRVRSSSRVNGGII